MERAEKYDARKARHKGKNVNKVDREKEERRKRVGETGEAAGGQTQTMGVSGKNRRRKCVQRANVIQGENETTEPESEHDRGTELDRRELQSVNVIEADNEIKQKYRGNMIAAEN